MYPGVEFPAPTGDINIRSMEVFDLNAVAAIERDSSPSPWNRNLFAGCLGKSYFCQVAVEGDQVIGFAIANCVLDEGTIVNIGVDPRYRRKGCGKQLLSSLVNYLSESNATTIYLEVRVSNISALRLYRKLGFAQTGLRKDYYSLGDRREDAVLMQKTVQS